MSNKKVVWLICMNVQPPEIDTHLRHQKFAKYLKDDGFEVYIIGASYLHYTKTQLITGNEEFIIKKYPDLNYIFINVTEYHENAGLKRLYSIFQFSWNLFRCRNKLPKPDVIVHNTRIPCDLPIIWTARKLKAKYITETWDLWPLSFVASGVLSAKNPLMWLFYKVEKYMYSHADSCVFTMEGCKDYIKDHKWDKEHGGPIDLSKVHYINNGIDIEDIAEQREQYQLHIPELEDKDTIKIVYLGSIGHVNAVDVIIQTAKLFSDRPKVRFLIFGKGGEREKLEMIVKDEKIDNVKFLNEWVEIMYVPYILSRADINIMNYVHFATLKYGGSQGKLFQYLAAGKPIVSNNKMGYDVVDRYGAGIAENIDTPEQYKEIICTILDDPEQYKQMSIACEQASKMFDLKNLYGDFKVVLDKVIGNEGTV